MAQPFVYRHELDAQPREVLALPPAKPVAPAVNPLLALADELQQLTRRELNALTGDRRKVAKTQLIAAYLAC